MGALIDAKRLKATERALIEEAVEVTLTVAAHILQIKAERVRRTPTFHVDQLDCPDFTRLMQKVVPMDPEHMATFIAKLDGSESFVPGHLKIDVPDLDAA